MRAVPKAGSEWRPPTHAGGGRFSWWHLLQGVGWVVATLVGLQAFSGGVKDLVLSVAAIEVWSNSLVYGPISAFAFGWLATVLCQSSSVVTTAAVGLVLAGMPLTIAVPVVLGANVGTTMTVAFLASLWTPQWGRERNVRALAWVHVLANVFAMPLFLLWILLLPEGNVLLFLSSFSATFIAQAPAPPSGSWFLPWQSTVSGAYSAIFGEPGVTFAVLRVVVGLGLVLFALQRLSGLLQRQLAVGAERLLLLSVSASRWRAFCCWCAAHGGFCLFLGSNMHAITFGCFWFAFGQSFCPGHYGGKFGHNTDRPQCCLGP